MAPAASHSSRRPGAGSSVGGNRRCTTRMYATCTASSAASATRWRRSEAAVMPTFSAPRTTAVDTSHAAGKRPSKPMSSIGPMALNVKKVASHRSTN